MSTGLKNNNTEGISSPDRAIILYSYIFIFAITLHGLPHGVKHKNSIKPEAYCACWCQ